MGQLNIDDKAPAFQLPASNGEELTLADFKDKKNLVLYFYPKDDTPGCTVEACGFRDWIKDFEKQEAVVLGVSPDSVTSHQKFSKKFQLPFLLLSDERKKTCADYGVLVEKNMYGKKYQGVGRTTFLINKQGRIAKIFERVTPQGHHAQILIALKELKSKP